MQQSITVRILPSLSGDDDVVRQEVIKRLAIDPHELTGFQIQKKSIDARSKQVWVNLTLRAFVNEPFFNSDFRKTNFGDVSHAPHQVIIAGAGPAGLFAALKLIEKGVRPVILERGK